MTEPLTGGCACGRVRYRLKSAPLFVNCCHCRSCQNQTGSAFVINALIETDRIELLSGELEITSLESDGSGVQDLYRCSACRIVVWSDYGRRPHRRFVRVGTLDDPGALPPDVHVYTRSKLDWVRIPEGVPRFDEYLDIDEHWPAASLARLRAAADRLAR